MQCAIDCVSDGASFVGLLSSRRSGPSNAPAFAEYDLGTPTAKYMIRDGAFKYTLWVNDIPGLYALRNDSSERRNLAANPSYQETVSRLCQQILDWH